MNKLIYEFIGTFFLVFTIGCAVASGSPLAALAIGSVLMVMVYAGGHLSGANYNPAVSLALLLRGKLNMGDFISYAGVQVVAGIIGAMASYYVTGGNVASITHAPGADVDVLRALVAEILGTFALAYVVLNVATTKANGGNSFYGLAIGFTVFAMAIGLGGVSGGAFNPAVGIGRNVADAILGGQGTIANIWIYIVGPLAGGALAAVVWNMCNSKTDND